MANTRGNRVTGANNAAEDLLRVERDKRIVALRLEERTLPAIATEVGSAVSTVHAALQRWMAEHGPASEQVDELRPLRHDLDPHPSQGSAWAGRGPRSWRSAASLGGSSLGLPIGTGWRSCVRPAMPGQGEGAAV